ncbi:MAG TPA: MFS transporter [Paludibacteraceae bacterium]|nr:MFS transporter [Paludibacteraceae bacterium]
MNNTQKMTNFRWTIVVLLFATITINYLDRQVLSLTWDEFIKPEFHFGDDIYGFITGFFSLFYAVCYLFAGRFVDWIGTKKGFLWAIGIWSLGACVHAVCGIVTESVVGLPDKSALINATGDTALVISTVGMWAFIVARSILALGESGNFPAAIKTTAEYFPKKDRAFATSIWNAGASVGALASPLAIPPIAKAFGWELAFIIIGALGFIWMGFWIFLYEKPEKSKYVNAAEVEYIDQDKHEQVAEKTEKIEKIPFLKCFTYKQTWSFAFGKFMTDGVWWFFLFWMPLYIKAQFNIKTTDPTGQLLIFTMYAIITVLSIYGGKLPTIFINRSGQNPYAARMKAMLIFAFIPLLALVAQPLGTYSYWFPVIIIALAGSAHQSWSANLFSTIGDMFPKGAIASITGIGGMAGGLGSFFLQNTAGKLFIYSEQNNLQFLGFEGKPAGYFIMFCFCAVAYLIGWTVMKALVPKYKPIVVE